MHLANIYGYATDEDEEKSAENGDATQPQQQTWDAWTGNEATGWDPSWSDPSTWTAGSAGNDVGSDPVVVFTCQQFSVCFLVCVVDTYFVAVTGGCRI